MSAVRVQLLDQFALDVDGSRVRSSVASQRVLAFLVLHRRSAARTFVAGSLWPDKTDGRAAGNLRSAIWRLPQSGRGIIDADNSNVSLAAGVRADVEELATRARALIDASPGACHTIPDVLRGELLPSWSDDWVVFERERVHQMRLHALEALSSLLATEGDYHAALEAAAEAVHAEPLRESAHRALMHAHAMLGNRPEVIRVYDALRRRLADELAIEPSRVTRQFVENVMQR